MSNSTLDSSAAPSSDAALVYANFLRGNLCSLSARVLFLWDYMVTLDDEVRYFWRGKMTLASVLFMVNRYVNLLIAMMEIMAQSPFQNIKSCGPFVRVLQSFLVISLLISAAFATLRIYAIWGCDWRPAAPILALALCSPILYIFMYANESAQPAPPPSVGCSISVQFTYDRYRKLLLANEASTVAYNGLALALTLVKSLGLRKRASELRVRTGISQFLLKDGTLYFFTFLCVNMAQLLTTATISWNDMNYAAYYVSPVTSVLISRFLLNLRGLSVVQDPTRQTTAYLTSYIEASGYPSDITGMASFGGPLRQQTRMNDTSNYDLVQMTNMGMEHTSKTNQAFGDLAVASYTHNVEAEL